MRSKKVGIILKIDRLVSMIFLLMKKKKISARELSDYFGCSVRTVYRDIETLENAGVPIISHQGVDGGFELVEGYRIEKPFLSSQEASTILGILEGLKHVIDDVELENISTKMQGADSAFSNIQFDMKGWGMSRDFKEKINLINSAIISRTAIEIDYYSHYLEHTKRTIHPLKFIIKGSSWYLYAYCLLKDDYRLFKVPRIKDIRFLESSFKEKKYIYTPPLNMEWEDKGEELVLKFSTKVYSSFKDFFFEENIVEYNEDYFIVKVTFPYDQWVLSLVLSYGDLVEVIKPERLKADLIRQARGILSLYNEE